MFPLLRLLPLCLTLGSVPAAAQIVAECVSAPACAVEGTLTLIAVADPSRKTNIHLRNGVAALAVPLTEEWQAELQADGFWMPRQTLAPSANRHVLRVWRATTLRGRFAVENAADQMPMAFQLMIESPPGPAGSAAIARETIDCPVQADGSWTCRVPAAKLDLVVRAKAFTPHYRWDVALDAPASLGSIVLRRGASVVAWLDRGTREALTKPAAARLVRMAMSEPSPTAVRLAQPVAEGSFNSRGMVQLAPLPPGTYTLEVAAPGFATARIEPVEVHARSESVLRNPIELGPPVTIHLALRPPRDPVGEPWRVELWRHEPVLARSQHVAKGPADETGVFVVAGQAAGQYRATVSDARGNRHCRGAGAHVPGPARRGGKRSDPDRSRSGRRHFAFTGTCRCVESQDLFQ